MKVYFNQPAFDKQLLRVLSHVYFGCADIGECLTTAARIRDNDFDTWHNEWMATADRVFEIAKQSEQNGHIVSAREAYLRASNYYRVAFFFMYAAPIDPRLTEAYDKHCLTFSRAAKLFSPAFEPIQIPFEGTYMPGYFYKVDDSNKARPTVIAQSGYDSTHQELYFCFVQGALARGYNVLTFDGPGQGNLLFKQNIFMRSNWETVITPIVNMLVERDDVDENKIALYGPSWGGMLAPRAAAYENRIAALIVNPGQYDVLENIKRAASGTAEVNPEAVTSLEDFFHAAMQDKFVGARFKSKMLVHGAETPIKLFEGWKLYNLIDSAPKIQCPTLVADGENEHGCAGQAMQLFNALTCPKEYVLFTNAEGAGEHCSAGATSLFMQRAFDWLDTTLEVSSKPEEENAQEVIILGYSQMN